MNISANTMPINSQASFKADPEETITVVREYSIEDAEKIKKLTEQLTDSFKKEDEPETKTPMGICASVLGAVLTTFVVGKCAASRVMTAFPSIAPKMTDCLKKSANFVRDYSDDVVKGAKLQKGGKYAKKVAGFVSKAEGGARTKFNSLAEKSGVNNVISNIVGLGAVASIAPEVLSVDGNKDGVADIAQKEINAYRNAAQKIGVVSEIVTALS